MVGAAVKRLRLPASLEALQQLRAWAAANKEQGFKRGGSGPRRTLGPLFSQTAGAIDARLQAFG